MSLFKQFRTMTLLALTAAVGVAPACDDGSQFEALGVEASDLEEMSAEELDALELELDERDEGDDETLEYDIDELRTPNVYTHIKQPKHLKNFTRRPRPTHGPAASAMDGLAAGPVEVGPCDPPSHDVELVAR